MDDFYSVKTFAAKVGGVSRWTVYGWLSKGLLRKTKVGGRVMIAAKDGEEFLRRCNPDRGSTVEMPVCELSITMSNLSRYA